MEQLRSVDGYTITHHQGLYTLTHATETIHVQWTRRGLRCRCGVRHCDHPSIVKAAQLTPTPRGFDTDMEPWSEKT